MDALEEPSPRDSPNSDADVSSPAASSNYSSCDGSEFDRYCSANSALGSASLCSSVGNHSELLESLKSSHRWNGFDGLLDVGGVETPRGNGSGLSPPSRNRTESKFSRSSLENSMSFKGKSTEDSESEGASFDYGRQNGYQGDVVLMDRRSSLAKVRTGSDSLMKSMDDSSLDKGKSSINATNSTIGSGLSEEETKFGENLSCEDSEGEASSIGYGSGDERRIHLVMRHKQQVSKESDNETGNPLFMNSSVAFGANDWDEFEQERAGVDLGSLSLYEDSLMQQQPSIAYVDGPSVKETKIDVKTQLRDNEVSSSQKSFSEEPSVEATSIHSEEAPHSDLGETSSKQIVDELELTVTPLCSSIFEQSFHALNRAFERKGTEADDIDEVGIGQDLAPKSILVTSTESIDVVGDDLLLNEVKNVDNSESCDDMVLEMEEILLDSGNSHGSRSVNSNGGYKTPHSQHFRDGSSTASTSGTDDVYPLLQYPPNIDRVEVIGAKQKKGDVSLGERLVGVKEYTIYKLRVWSDKDQWEVERRYRDFFGLYRQLYAFFMDLGLSLPPPWSRVEKESRKIFGNASPDVISKRSILIQDCLQSILNSKYSFGTPSSMVSFLSPGQPFPNSSLLKSLVPQSLHKLGKDQLLKSFSLSSSKNISMLGKTISLVVEIKPHKSMRQLLEAQHYMCAGCHRQLDAGKTLLREIVQTIGWNKPRFCEYTSQLFCASCHTNDTIVLPAKVLHHWDFSLYPVSQLAKAYLESIYDQPMLCVSAVNPFLFPKVPALFHVTGIRKKIGAMLPYVRCPFRKAVQRSLGVRRYLLESNDFFALRDLVDLSKGAFAGS
ncbi:uncharacterized protein LOC109840556 isoform X2 [Asparagus officinalis]|uniref:uncharacterized protein LOC109840556 isoform X2 n=1 Tax=Asparagus officinalis TaxID=4686 RepID=UPI00098E191B|nr:uncharacterized protein LOC109840556 isoform X2 [Asparagus officinalis]